MAKKKIWLREECGWILYSAVQSLQNDSHHSKYVQLIIEKVETNDLTRTPEGIAIWIGTALKFPNVALPHGVWHNENPLHKKEKAKLARILRGSSSGTPDQGGDVSNLSGQGIWTPKLHFAWDVLLGRILQVQSKGGSKEIGLAEFWKECVDGRSSRYT